MVAVGVIATAMLANWVAEVEAGQTLEVSSSTAALIVKFRVYPQDPLLVCPDQYASVLTGGHSLRFAAAVAAARACEPVKHP